MRWAELGAWIAAGHAHFEAGDAGGAPPPGSRGKSRSGTSSSSPPAWTSILNQVVTQRGDPSRLPRSRVPAPQARKMLMTPLGSSRGLPADPGPRPPWSYRRIRGPSSAAGQQPPGPRKLAQPCLCLAFQRLVAKRRRRCSLHEQRAGPFHKGWPTAARTHASSPMRSPRSVPLHPWPQHNPRSQSPVRAALRPPS